MMISLPGLSEPVAFSLMNKSMSSSTLQFSRVLRIFSFAYQQRDDLIQFLVYLIVTNYTLFIYQFSPHIFTSSLST